MTWKERLQGHREVAAAMFKLGTIVKPQDQILVVTYSAQNERKSEPLTCEVHHPLQAIFSTLLMLQSLGCNEFADILIMRNNCIKEQLFLAKNIQGYLEIG